MKKSLLLSLVLLSTSVFAQSYYSSKHRYRTFAESSEADVSGPSAVKKLNESLQVTVGIGSMSLQNPKDDWKYFDNFTGINMGIKKNYRFGQSSFSASTGIGYERLKDDIVLNGANLEVAFNKATIEQRFAYDIETSGGTMIRPFVELAAGSGSGEITAEGNGKKITVKGDLSYTQASLGLQSSMTERTSIEGKLTRGTLKDEEGDTMDTSAFSINFGFTM